MMAPVAMSFGKPMARMLARFALKTLTVGLQQAILPISSYLVISFSSQQMMAPMEMNCGKLMEQQMAPCVSMISSMALPAAILQA